MAVQEDDWAGMLAEVEARLDQGTISAALGARDEELELVAAGMAPKPALAKRLRALHELSQRADLADPGSLLEAVTGGRATMVPLAALPRIRTLFIAFVVIDAAVLGVVLLIVFAR